MYAKALPDNTWSTGTLMGSFLETGRKSKTKTTWMKAYLHKNIDSIYDIGVYIIFT